jgi:hypothetical protein
VSLLWALPCTLTASPTLRSENLCARPANKVAELTVTVFVPVLTTSQIRRQKGGLVRISEGVVGAQLSLVSITQTGHLHRSDHCSRQRSARFQLGVRVGLSLARLLCCSPELGVLQATR